MRIRRDVANGPRAAADARRAVNSLTEHVPREVLEDVRLVASELVTNSHKHAGNPPGHPIQLTLDVHPDRVRLEVVDRSIFDPAPESREELRDAKWGLVLVDRIADAWGRIDPPEGGIWAEFRTPPSG